MLTDKLQDPHHGVLLYGTTPPRAGATEEQVRAAADKLAARLAPLPLDGVVVYDIQDESGRTATARPFAFTGTVDPRDYSRLLASVTRRPAITYKCVGDLDEAAWQQWLAEAARDYGVKFLSIVGRPTSGVTYPLSLSKAIRLAAAHPAGFEVGGVVIAERHTGERSESARMLAKGIEGCSYFISQTVYSAEATIRLLADYARDCRGAGVPPRRVILSFSPVGREKTLAFLKWLGVSVPEATAGAILGAANPLSKSIEVCRDNLARILDQPYAKAIPLGISVESVSINKDEIDASVDLVHALRAALPQ
ncbi:MAG: methylenetetrahydrofolate reductase [Betaproteobacteria bacterium]